MTFDEVLSQVQDLLQREQRVSYRGLKRRFALDDEYLEDLKEELIGAKRLAVDEDGRFLVWTGAAPVPSSESRVTEFSPTPNPTSPIPSQLHAAAFGRTYSRGASRIGSARSEPTANARRSPPCLPISKARPR